MDDVRMVSLSKVKEIAVNAEKKCKHPPNAIVHDIHTHTDSEVTSLL